MSLNTRGRSQAEILDALRHQWFPVARAVDLAAPVEATLLGERLVAYRTAAGEPRVLQRRCVHRGGNLAKGEVHGDALACPYHGWQFDGASGACVHVPSLDPAGERRIPDTARIASYPAVEHWGHVWTCLEEPVGALPEPPEFAALDLGEWVAGPTIHSSIGLVATTENFRDVAHFPFVHRGTMGEVPHVVETLDVQREGIEVWMSRTVPEHEDASSWSSNTGDAVMRYHTIAPGVSIIVYEYERTGSRVLFGTPAPISATECTIFWGVANDAAFTGLTVQEAMEAEYAVYQEDIPVVCDLDPPEVVFDGSVREVSVPADRFTLAYRRAVLEYVDRALAVRAAATNGSGVAG